MHWCLFDEYPFGVKVTDTPESIRDAVLTTPYDLDEERDGLDPYTGDFLRRILDKSSFSRIKASAMKYHPFFAGVEWDEIRRRRGEGPFWSALPDKVRVPVASDKPQADEKLPEVEVKVEVEVRQEDIPERVPPPAVADLSASAPVAAEVLAPPDPAPLGVPSAPWTRVVHPIMLLPFLVPFLFAFALL